MDEKSIRTLELPKVLARLADQAAFSASKSLAQSLAPSSDFEEVARRQAETSEARLLLSLNPGLTIGGARDVRPQAGAARRGVVLEASDFLDVKSTLIAARSIQRRFEKENQQFPSLTQITARLQPVPGLVDAVSRVLSERGEVLDNASDKLAKIRRELNIARERLVTRLQRLVGDPKLAPMLQEPIVTQREGRFVIPLRAEFKGRIKAVIHDQSSSGATLFVEPLQVVDLNNQLRQLELDERDEVRRVLAELSSLVGQAEEEIKQTVEALAELDLAFAKAHLADDMDAEAPILHPWSKDQPQAAPTLRLMAARHPLLDPRSVVPIDLELGPGVRALVITGPNTGGKTVTLKTAGLLALMSQCGLHLPVESGSEISVFEAVFADIGDEQSIEQSLSTFSAHISNIIRILKQIDARALVVLDELGAGTDPQEGSALARALLQTFLDRRATTLVATHYPELKAFAHASERIRNASVEFDLESLRPTYHLMLGLPGRSNALAIAERLGLDREIIAAARAMISPDELRAEELLDEIHRERDLARQARAESEAARGRLQEQNRELLERLEAIEDERLEILDQARQEAQAGLDALQGELAQLRRQLELARQPLEALEAVSEKARELERQVKRPPKRASVKVEEHTRPLRAGDKVHLKTLNCEGLITYLESGQAEVQVGRLRVRADLNELRPVGAGGHEASSEPRAKRRKPPAPAMGGQPAPAPPPLEMDLRGQTVEEALLEVDRRLDAAFLSGMPFLRLIHGKGSGRLREAIRDALRGNPYVGSYRAGDPGEGGEGVTVVKLAPN